MAAVDAHDCGIEGSHMESVDAPRRYSQFMACTFNIHVIGAMNELECKSHVSHADVTDSNY